MTVIDPNDPDRYVGGHALIVIGPAETALRREIRRLADRDVLTGPQRDRIVEHLRAAARAANRHMCGTAPDV